jgi:hypothetical protein
MHRTRPSILGLRPPKTGQGLTRTPFRERLRPKLTLPGLKGLCVRFQFFRILAKLQGRSGPFCQLRTFGAMPPLLVFVRSLFWLPSVAGASFIRMRQYLNWMSCSFMLFLFLLIVLRHRGNQDRRMIPGQVWRLHPKEKDNRRTRAIRKPRIDTLPGSRKGNRIDQYGLNRSFFRSR